MHHMNAYRIINGLDCPLSMHLEDLTLEDAKEGIKAILLKEYIDPEDPDIVAMFATYFSSETKDKKGVHLDGPNDEKFFIPKDEFHDGPISDDEYEVLMFDDVEHFFNKDATFEDMKLRGEQLAEKLKNDGLDEDYIDEFNARINRKILSPRLYRKMREGDEELMEKYFPEVSSSLFMPSEMGHSKDPEIRSKARIQKDIEREKKRDPNKPKKKEEETEEPLLNGTELGINGYYVGLLNAFNHTVTIHGNTFAPPKEENDDEDGTDDTDDGTVAEPEQAETAEA